MTRASPMPPLAEARQVAMAHRLRIVEKRTAAGCDYLLYRIVAGRAVYIGMSWSEKGIRDLVRRAAIAH